MNKILYEKFIDCKNKKKISYKKIAEELHTNPSNIHDKINRLKNGNSVRSDFLMDLEKVLGEKIFFRD